MRFVPTNRALYAQTYVRENQKGEFWKNGVMIAVYIQNRNVYAQFVCTCVQFCMHSENAAHIWYARGDIYIYTLEISLLR